VNIGIFLGSLLICVYSKKSERRSKRGPDLSCSIDRDVNLQKWASRQVEKKEETWIGLIASLKKA